MISVQAISLKARTAVTSDGRTIPITTLYDLRGEETDDTEAATAFVAGPDADRKWHSGLVREFGTAGVN